ncbi:MAG: hypothetical protein EOO29_39380, partial [Comamonadaceae bacterium]
MPIARAPCLTSSASDRRAGSTPCGSLTRRSCLIAALGTAWGAGTHAGVHAQPAGASSEAPRWLAAWAVAERDYRQQLVAPGLAIRPPRVLNDQTVRLRVMAGLGGSTWRVRLSNRWGLEPLRIDQATLALSTGGAAVSPRSVVPLSFGGQSGLALAPGTTQWSDAVRLPALAGQQLALSFHLARPFALGAGYPITREGGAGWLMPGEQCSQAQPRDAQPLDWAPALSGLDVQVGRDARLLVAFGDSLTAGT